MAKTKAKAKKKNSKQTTVKNDKTESTLTNAQKMQIFNVVANAGLMRSTMLNKLIDDRRDIDLECGYPKELTTEQYKLMYDREGIATRVVSIFPEESWVNDPEVLENDDPKDTEFEQKWKELEQEKQLYATMLKVDELSGIGRFGILLLGINDQKDLKEPVEGIDATGKKIGNQQYELLYIRAFSESEVTIKAVEKDPTNPRFGKPTLYTVTFDTSTTYRTSAGVKATDTSQEQQVHWTRVVHIADNRKTSEVYGVPRIQNLFNRLYDLRKILGGSGEMFWKGGFPGYAFEMDPNARALTTDQETALKDEIANYANGLQRYMKLQGITVNSLDPQVADPKAHVEVQFAVVAIVLGIPKRIFMGAEQAKLASTQDTKSWNKRIARRENKYLSPYVIRPLVDRLIAFGTLPEVDSYKIVWPDLDSPSDMDKAEVLAKLVEAFSKYVAGGVDALIPEEIFFSLFVGLDADQIQAIKDAIDEREQQLEQDAHDLEDEDIPDDGDMDEEDIEEE
jgi:hypothetical protein